MMSPLRSSRYAVASSRRALAHTCQKGKSKSQLKHHIIVVLLQQISFGAPLVHLSWYLVTMGVFLHGSAENWCAIYTIHGRFCLYHGRIWIYTFFLLVHNNDESSWTLEWVYTMCNFIALWSQCICHWRIAVSYITVEELSLDCSDKQQHFTCDTHILCFFKTVVVIGSKKVVHTFRLIATKKFNVPLNHMRRRCNLLLAHRSRVCVLSMCENACYAWLCHQQYSYVLGSSIWWLYLAILQDCISASPPGGPIFGLNLNFYIDVPRPSPFPLFFCSCIILQTKEGKKGKWGYEFGWIQQ